LYFGQEKKIRRRERRKEGKKARNIYFTLYSIQGRDQNGICNKKIFSIGSVEMGLPRGMVNLL
jgi:hypothetical protein